MDKIRIKEKIKEVEAFEKSQLYRNYLFTLQKDVEGTERSILLIPPSTPELAAEQMRLHGYMEALQKNLSIFEELRSTLEAALEAQDEADQQATSTDKP